MMDECKRQEELLSVKYMGGEDRRNDSRGCVALVW